MSTASDFFYAHASYSYDPKTQTAEEGRRETAIELALAERLGIERGFDVIWTDDDDPLGSLGEGEEEPYLDGSLQVLQAVLYDEDGEVLASLGGVGIHDRDIEGDAYLRVVEAQLALEALTA